MARPVTLCTGQWADLPLEELARKCSEFGYDGLELACWGDHFEVDKALAEPDYCSKKHAIAGTARHERVCRQRPPGGPGGAGSDRRAAPGHPAAGGLGRRRSGGRERPGRRGNEEHGAGGAEVRRQRGQRLHRFEHLALVLFFPAGAAADDRRRLQAACRALESDSGRVRRVRREVRLGSPPDRDRLRPGDGRAGDRCPGRPRGVRLQFRSQPSALAGRRSGGIHPRLPGPDLSTFT